MCTDVGRHRTVWSGVGVGWTGHAIPPHAIRHVTSVHVHVGELDRRGALTLLCRSRVPAPPVDARKIGSSTLWCHARPISAGQFWDGPAYSVLS